MNNNNKIMERLREHYDAALQLFPADRIVGIKRELQRLESGGEENHEN